MNTKNPFSLASKIILITGAVGKLGRKFTNDFIENGAHVIGLDVIDESTIDFAYLHDPSKFDYYQVDITSKRHLQDIYNSLEELNLLPNVLINNAAAGQVSFLEGDLVDFTDFPVEVWNHNLSVNMTGALFICQIFGKNLELIKSGSVINMSSTYGLVGCDQRIYGDSGLNSSIAYAATKSALLGMTKYLAAYWGHLGIRVNSVAPAGIFNNHTDPFLSNYTNKIMLGRMGKSSDISNALIYLASDASEWVTGSTLSVDGGYVAW